MNEGYDLILFNTSEPAFNWRALLLVAVAINRQLVYLTLDYARQGAAHTVE